MKNLIIVGCGPKAVAIAANAYVLKKLGWDVPDITIIEKYGIAANWDGTNGYTDGQPHLGTPPTEDIGFPYLSSFGSLVNEELFKLSFFSYKIDSGNYTEWINRKQQAPTHSMFADYFKWVIKKISQEVKIGRVTKISLHNDKWIVHYKDNSEVKEVAGDGLVITGPGDPYEFPRLTNNDGDKTKRIFNGQNVWKNMSHFKDLRHAKIAVIGGGETAAAIVTSLINKIDDSSQIEIIIRHPMLFSRNENWMEVMFFSTAHNWTKLSTQEKMEVIRHADRGTFSPPTKELLDSAYNVNLQMGSAEGIGTFNEKVYVNFIEKGETKKIEYDYVIEATGFNPFSFIDLFEDKSILEEIKLLPEKIEKNLSVKGIYPYLHLPRLAAINQGPGFPHLSCLGLLSERILSSYITKN